MRDRKGENLHFTPQGHLSRSVYLPIIYISRIGRYVHQSLQLGGGKEDISYHHPDDDGSPRSNRDGEFIRRIEVPYAKAAGMWQAGRHTTRRRTRTTTLRDQTSAGAELLSLPQDFSPSPYSSSWEEEEEEEEGTCISIPFRQNSHRISLEIKKNAFAVNDGSQINKNRNSITGAFGHLPDDCMGRPSRPPTTLRPTPPVVRALPTSRTPDIVLQPGWASCLRRLPLPQRQQRPHIRHVLQALEQRDQVQQVVVRGVRDPAFDGDGVV
jgi:hypothetical protein